MDLLKPPKSWNQTQIYNLSQHLAMRSFRGNRPVERKVGSLDLGYASIIIFTEGDKVIVLNGWCPTVPMIRNGEKMYVEQLERSTQNIDQTIQTSLMGTRDIHEIDNQSFYTCRPPISEGEKGKIYYPMSS